MNQSLIMSSFACFHHILLSSFSSVTYHWQTNPLSSHEWTQDHACQLLHESALKSHPLEGFYYQSNRHTNTHKCQPMMAEIDEIVSIRVLLHCHVHNWWCRKFDCFVEVYQETKRYPYSMIIKNICKSSWQSWQHETKLSIDMWQASTSIIAIL